LIRSLRRLQDTVSYPPGEFKGTQVTSPLISPPTDTQDSLSSTFCSFGNSITASTRGLVSTTSRQRGQHQLFLCRLLRPVIPLIPIEHLSATKETLLLPEETSSNKKHPSPIFTYRAQLTFGLSAREGNRHRGIHARNFQPNFSLLPCEDEKSQQVSSIEQFPENNPLFSTMSYHNHSVKPWKLDRDDCFPMQ
jgi:hypothetical protein